MKACSIIVSMAVLLAGWCCAAARAQEAPDDKKTEPDMEKIKGELDKFREDLFHLFNEEKYKEMLEKHVHKDVVATWQDGTTSKGHDGVLAEFTKLKQFIDKMTVDKPITDMRLPLNNGKLVIASGPMHDEYVLKNWGTTVKLSSRWQATLVRESDRWVLVGFEASTNAFANPVIDLYLQKTQYIYGGVAGGIGLVVGIVIGAVVARRRRP